MGLIHSRAAKQRDKAEAKLLDEQRREMKHSRRAAGAADHAERIASGAPSVTGEIRAAGKAQREEIRATAAAKRETRRSAEPAEPGQPWWRQPTLGQAIKRARSE